MLVNDETQACVNPMSLGPVASAAFPDWDLRFEPLLPAWKYAVAKALSYLPVVGEQIMSPYEREAFSAKTTLSNARAKSELGLAFRPHADSVADCVRSIVDGGFATPKLKKA